MELSLVFNSACVPFIDFLIGPKDFWTVFQFIKLFELASILCSFFCFGAMKCCRESLAFFPFNVVNSGLLALEAFFQ